jgi:hypothetical protein
MIQHSLFHEYSVRSGNTKLGAGRCVPGAAIFGAKRPTEATNATMSTSQPMTIQPNSACHSAQGSRLSRPSRFGTQLFGHPNHYNPHSRQPTAA